MDFALPTARLYAMSHPIDAPTLETPADYQVKAILNTFSREQCGEQQLLARLAEVCREHPGAAWQALALLDQLHRRGVLTTELFRNIKSELNVIVFSSTGTYEAIASQKPNGHPVLRAVPSVNRTRRKRSAASSVIELDLPLELPGELPASANAMSFQPLRLGALLSDRYEIIEPVLAGSASVTFRALDRWRESLPEADRYVAIRWLDEHLQSDPHAVTALQNEYAHLKAIAHPNIPKVYDIHDSIGACSIVMELPAGEYLKSINERLAGRWRIAQAVTLIREIGLALMHAHAHDVVHGNLHPGNVLVTRSGEVRVYDFAQADAWANLAEGGQNRAQNGVALPARRYCSPRRLGSIDARIDDDLYSLAAIAYEVLCGHPADLASLSCSAWQQPSHATHLTRRQWRALKRALTATFAEHGSVSEWLSELGTDQAMPRLPALADIAVDVPPPGRYSVPR
jgi:hypothetical protein